MKIFITGFSGFLGTHLKNEFAKYKEIELITPSHKECNLLSRQQISYLLKETKPNSIIHLAANVGGLEYNKNHPADLLHENLDMASNLFAAAKEANCKTIYSLGSVCSYGAEMIPPFKEDNIWDSFPELTNSGYGISKRVLMLLGQMYKAQYEFRGVHFIPINMYGAFDTFDPKRSHVIPALIKKFLDAKKNNKEYVECFGDGTCSRSFLHARDCSQALVKAVLSNLDTDLPINLGTDKEILIKDLAELIKKLTRYEGKIVFTNQIGNGQNRRSLDASRAKELLDWEAKTSLRDGLIETIEWYKENYMKE